jgi:hypothetical protein
MDPDEERDFADQRPHSDSDLDGDTQILATLLKHIPGCINAADIELLLQDIPVQPPVVIPDRTMQEAIQAEDMPPYCCLLCAPSTLFYLYIVPDRRQGAQWFTQRGFPGLFQHV